MKKLSGVNKIIYFFNVVLSIFTFMAYLLPFLTPKWFPILSVLTLILPLFLILNGLFFIYWLIQIKRQIILSTVVLFIGITFINKFYKFSGLELPKSQDDFTVMSYNVRLFNLFHWIDDKNIAQNIHTFINEQNPDILCLQEFSENANVDLRIYKYKYILSLGKKIKTAQAIFSKFKIIKSGDIKFPNSNNNAIFADIKKGKDTIRIYNIHLQSIKISPDLTEIDEGKKQINKYKSEKIFMRISQAFRLQQLQASLIKIHQKNCIYPLIICGDMNNSAYSFIYRNIRGELNDSFEEAGYKFGKTYDFKYYPFRIDYIFTDKRIKVKSFENFSNFKNSDHFPIMSRLSMQD